jgi:hypothetical protein
MVVVKAEHLVGGILLLLGASLLKESVQEIQTKRRRN